MKEEKDQCAFPKISHVDNCRVDHFLEAVFKEDCTKQKNEQRFNCVLQNQQLEAFLVEKMDKLKLLGLLFHTKNVTYLGQNTKPSC